MPSALNDQFQAALKDVLPAVIVEGVRLLRESALASKIRCQSAFFYLGKPYVQESHHTMHYTVFEFYMDTKDSSIYASRH